MFHVASYNIRRGLGTDLRRNLGRNLAVLREIDADVVAVQEADPILRDLFDNGSTATADYIPVMLDPIHGDISWRGNVMLVRRDATVIDVHCIALPSFGEARGAIVVELAIARQRLRFVAMHLGLLGSWRTRQAAALLRRVNAFEIRLPTVMLGDLNEWHDGGASLVHFAREHHVASPGRTFPSRLPLLPLDKIIINPDLRLVASGVHDSALARRASDHLPIWARLTVVAPHSSMAEPEQTKS